MEKGKFRIVEFPSLIRETFVSWKKQDPWQLSIVVAFYVLLSLPGLLLVVLNFVGALLGEDFNKEGISEQVMEIAGKEAADAVRVIIETSREEKQSTVSTLFGVGTFLFGVTGAFYSVQLSVNKIWGVKPSPDSGIKKVLLDRIFGFSFLLILGILMFVSFVITALLSVFIDTLKEFVPDFAVYLAYVLNEVFSLAFVAVFFALLYRFLPDVKISWKVVWIGSFMTALLFEIGKFLLGLYFSRVNPVSAFGAAGSILLILLWITYSAFIFFFGAQFTCIFQKRYGLGIRPKDHAVRVRLKEEFY